MFVFMREDDRVKAVFLSCEELGAEVTRGSCRECIAVLGEDLFVLGLLAEGFDNECDSLGFDRLVRRCDNVCTSAR